MDIPTRRVVVYAANYHSQAPVEKAMETLLPLKAKTTTKPPQSTAMSEAEMTSYTGNYVHSPRANIEIVTQNGKLFWKRRDDLFPLAKIGNLRFMIPSSDPTEQEEFVLIPDSDGKAQYLHMDGRGYRKR